MTTYVIIEDGCRQLKVAEGDQVNVDYRDVRRGDEVTFDRVLAYRSDGEFKMGRPLLDAAKVTAEVLGVVQGPKLVVQKFRRRKNSRRKTGHRQMYLQVKVTGIDVP